MYTPLRHYYYYYYRITYYDCIQQPPSVTNPHEIMMQALVDNHLCCALHVWGQQAGMHTGYRGCTHKHLSGSSMDSQPPTHQEAAEAGLTADHQGLLLLFFGRQCNPQRPHVPV